LRSLAGIVVFSPLTFVAASYGKMARYKDVRRIHTVNGSTILGAGGEMSDFNYIKQLLEDLTYANRAYQCTIERGTSKTSHKQLFSQDGRFRER
jgi:hypothetical protein